MGKVDIYKRQSTSVTRTTTALSGDEQTKVNNILTNLTYRTIDNIHISTSTQVLVENMVDDNGLDHSFHM